MPNTQKYDRAKIADWIDLFWLKNYRPPSLSDICAGCGVSSPSVANRIVRKIAKQRGDLISGRKGKPGMITPRWVVEAIDDAQL